MEGNNDNTNNSQMMDEVENFHSITDEQIDEELEAMINDFVTNTPQEIRDLKAIESNRNDDLVIDGKVIPRYVKLGYHNIDGVYTFKRAINPEWVRAKLESEGCTVKSEIRGIYDPIIYEYKGKEFKVTWNEWNKGKRPHKLLIDLDETIELIDEPKEDGISVYCNRVVKTKTGYCKKRLYNPDWVYWQFLKENCELINEYINGETKLQYYYIGNDPTADKSKVYTTTFHQWRSKGIRKHLKQYGKNEEFYKQAKAQRKAHQSDQ